MPNLDLDKFVADLPVYEEPRRADPFAYLDPATREILRKLQEMEKFTHDSMQRAHEMVIEQPMALQRRMELDNQKRIIDKLTEQNEILSQLKRLQGKEEDITTIPEFHIPGIDEVFLHYPQFKEDIPLLKVYDYIRIVDGKLVWDKSKRSLAEYFANLPQKNKTIRWDIVEALFHINDLKNSYSKNGSSYNRKKPSKDYEVLLNLKNLQNTPKGV